MKKSFIAFTVIAAMSLILAGCTKTELTDTEKEMSKVNVSVDNDWVSLAEEEIENYIENAEKNQEQLAAYIDTYEKYSANIDKIEAFYGYLYEVNKSLCLQLYEYSIEYAESVLHSDKTDEEKYDDLELIIDCIYEGMVNDIYDGIYHGVLDDMYNDFYDGVLDDAYDNLTYEKWNDVRSNEYDLYLYTKSDVYDDWSDCRSDIYSFCCDVRSEMYSGDVKGAQKKTEKLKKDMKKFKESTPSSAESERTETEAHPEFTFEVETEPVKTEESKSPSDGISPEFKRTMDTYEAFFDDYIEFMQSFSESSDALSMMTEYLDYLEKYTEYMEALEDMENEEMSDEELAYYTEVMFRITQKLLNSYT